jgi:nuclear transport factor 2 (NTF2) superfamily protein
VASRESAKCCVAAPGEAVSIAHVRRLAVHEAPAGTTPQSGRKERDVDDRLIKELWDAQGLMTARHASINDLPIREEDRKFRWPLGRRPDDHPGLSSFGF